MTSELTEACHFLLDHPPLEEIGGTIVDVIERYRFKTITKQQAEHQMLREHNTYLSKFVKEKELLLV